MQDDNVSGLLEKDENELLRLLGEELKPRGFAMDKRTDEEKEVDGRDWFQRNTAALQGKICRNPQVTDIISGGRVFGRVELVAAIVDMVALVTTGVSPTLISVIIVKRGLSEFCSITTAPAH